MLTEADRELITAAVDGELPPDREQAARRLLAESAEATALFGRLQADSRRLRALPRVPAPPAVAVAVAARVRPVPVATPASAVPAIQPTARRAGWLAYAVAASVLLAVAAGSFWVTLREDGADAVWVAQRQSLPHTPEPATGRFAQSPAVPPEALPELLPTPRYATRPNPGDEGYAVLPSPAPAVEAAPLPRQAGAGEVVGSSLSGDPKPFRSVEVRVPLVAVASDLDREDVRSQLLDELARDPAFRLDLFVRDVHRAADAFQAAARAAGVNVAVDSAVPVYLRKKAPVVLAVYTEALSAEDIVKLLGQVAKQARAGAKGQAAFGTAHLVPAREAEQRDLHDLLGRDPGLWKRPRAGGPKAVSSGTVEQLTASLDRGGKPALMLVYLPVALRVNPNASKEVRAFLDHRDERKPTAIPLLIVIRPVG